MVVAGEVNYQSAPLIREALQQLGQEGQLNLALDCRSVDFIDSSGMGAIVHMAQVLKQAGGCLKLLGATPQLIHALQVAGFAQLVDLEATVQPGPRVVQPEADPSRVCQRASISIPIHADRNGLVRRRVTDLAEGMPFTQQQIDDIRLAVGEAVSNAVKHGRWEGEHTRLTVRCIGNCEKLVVEVHNPGEAFDPDATPIPDPSSRREGGLGIFFMKTAMDLVEYTFDETGTTVRMVKFVMANGARDGNGTDTGGQA